MTIFAAVIGRRRLRTRYADAGNPFRIELQFCMEQLHAMLSGKRQRSSTVHVNFERRGGKEDRELELEFRRIAANDSGSGPSRQDFELFDFRPLFVPKAANSVGLQLSDLTARPIALSQLRPNQPKLAFEIVRPRIGGLAKLPRTPRGRKNKRAPEAPGPFCRPGNSQSLERHIAGGRNVRQRIRPGGHANGADCGEPGQMPCTGRGAAKPTPWRRSLDLTG